MGNCKFPISDEKLEMVCDKEDIYHFQYLKSNHWVRKSNTLFENESPLLKKKMMDLSGLKNLFVAEDECEHL